MTEDLQPAQAASVPGGSVAFARMLPSNRSKSPKSWQGHTPRLFALLRVGSKSIRCHEALRSFAVRMLFPSFDSCSAVWCLVGNGGMDPYSSPYIIPNNSPHNPFPPFPTKNQTVRPPCGCVISGAKSGAPGFRACITLLTHYIL